MRLKQYTFTIIFALFCSFSAISQGKEQKQYLLANNYYKAGEFQKALLIYKKLYEAKPYSYNYVYKLVDVYQQLEQYNNAKLVLEAKTSEKRRPEMLIELGYNYQITDSLQKAEKLYNEAIALLDEKPVYIYGISQRFEIHSLLPQAIKAYKKAEILSPEKNFSLQLARIYGDLGDIKSMFSTYLDYVAFKPNSLNNIKRNLSQFISENKDTENNKSLRVLLLKKLQSDPDEAWYELLSWLYVQEKQYNKSFVQERALYKRNPESLDRIIDLAYTAKDENDIETATEIYNYILEVSQDKQTKLFAYQSLLEIETENASKKELDTVNEKYLELLKEYEKTETFPLQVSYSQFLAFNYNQPEEGAKLLKKILKLKLSQFQNGSVKLRLADILVLQEKFNEALIYYTQIKANLKNSSIAQEAAYKIAKTSYYKGDFEWAESQLKVLKASTSQLIANDALDLKLLISDNKWDDSTQTALKYYAKADLFAFQKKNSDAIKLLDKVLTEHNGESIIDQTLFTQAKLYEKQQQYEKAEANYQKIIADYREDILIDDAYYYLAELYNYHLAKPEEAKPLYEKIIFNHEDSIYFVEARKKFRMLRGDTIN